MAPESIRCPPNQSTAMLDMFTISMTVGNISAIRRPVRRETSVSCSFAEPYRARSRSSRTNARITRMPAICSRMIRLMLSMRVCMVRNSGRIRRMIKVTTMTRIGTMTRISEDSGTSWFSASTMPPTHMIGADTSSVKVSRTSICTCCTSFVVRVISDGAPNWPTSRAENSCTREKIAARTSRPTAIAVRAPK